MKKLRIGDLLVKHGKISPEQLDKALTEQRGTGKRLGDLLVDLGFILESDLLNFLAQQLAIPYLDLDRYQRKADIAQLVPENMARRLKAVPIDKVVGSFLVVMVDPTDLVAYDEISRKLKSSIRVALVKEAALDKYLGDIYQQSDKIAHLVGELEEEMQPELSLLPEVQEGSGDAPIIKLLNSIFEDAVKMNASDIHIEPDKDVLRIRQRIDGVLQEQVMKGSNIISALVLRLKLMAKLNISERRLPQDGRFSITVSHRKIDVRLSTLPVQEGESVVLRLLDQTSERLNLTQMGMTEKIAQCFKRHLKKPHGMILVTGPTGSGKSTTLYAGLSEINTIDKKIITVEDPVEYSFERVNQVQVKPKIGLDFATVLRSALRQDPDVVMVGEIRDEETAAIALRAAMTGHLVLSTLHTNDAVSSPIRLVDMGVDPFLAASALRLVIAQRLIRRVCPHCQVAYKPNDREVNWIGAILKAPITGMHFVKGQGCSKCRMSGYQGRVGVFEILEVNAPMAEGLRENNVTKFRQEAEKTALFRPLTHWALDYAIQGLTSIDEVYRIAGELEDEQ